MRPHLAACLPRRLWSALPGVAVALALLAPGQAASAAVCERGLLQARLAEIDPSIRPDPDGGPTDVDLGLMLNDLHSIDDVRERFTVDLRVELAWRDARLTPEALGCEAAGARPLIDTIWHRELMMMNGIDVDSLVAAASRDRTGRSCAPRPAWGHCAGAPRRRRARLHSPPSGATPSCARYWLRR